MGGITDTQRVAALLTVLYNGERAEGLFRFAPPSDQRALEEVMAEVLPIPEVERCEYIWHRLQALCSKEKMCALFEVHPSWLLEKIRDENPRVIGIVLRYLPSTHVRYILKHLPKKTRLKLPKLVESFAVPASVLQVIRWRFERQFTKLGRSVGDVSQLTFRELYLLSLEELEEMLYDLGIHELALALKDIDRSAVKVVLDRIGAEEADLLKRRLKILCDEQPELIKQAQQTVLEANFSTSSNSRELMIELGINSLAKSMTELDRDVFRLMQHKLSPRWGYLLKRCIEEQLGRGTITNVEERRSMIMSRLVALAHSGRIDEKWSRLAS